MVKEVRKESWWGVPRRRSGISFLTDLTINFLRFEVYFSFVAHSALSAFLPIKRKVVRTESNTDSPLNHTHGHNLAR